MPNWCSNDLYISGKNVNAVLTAIASPETPIDFNLIIPMPETLKIESGTLTDAALCVAMGTLEFFGSYPWMTENGIDTPEKLAAHFGKTAAELLPLGEQVKTNLQKYGCKTWYEWSRDNWGTKWNASAAVIEKQTATSAKLRFDTAWSPPAPIIKALAAKFPAYTFTLKYYEMGCGFKGTLKVKGDAVLVDESGDYRGNRGG